MTLCVRLTERGVEPLRRDSGGVVLDEGTGTRLLQGAQARDFLESRQSFEHETEVFVPADSEIDLRVGLYSSHLRDSIAVHLAPGVEASCRVLQGEPVVITNERTPAWYEPYHPDSFQDYAYQQATRGAGLAHGYVHQSVLGNELLDKLGDRVERAGEDFRFRPGAELVSGLSAEEQARVQALHTRTRLNQLPGRLYGSFAPSKLSAEQRQDLKERGLMQVGLDGQCKWRTFASPEELGLSPEVARVYRETNHRDYDTTGLVFRAPGVSAYARSDKTNLWSHEPSEWMLTSGCVGAPAVGLSSIATEGPLPRPVDFRAIRPNETLHSHPPQDQEGVSEAYVVTGGSAALLAVQGGKPYLHLLHAGDLAVVPPGLAHCLLAASGDYEHLVVQTPSTFQYGLRFKQDLEFPVDRAQATSRAVQELAAGTRGSVAL